jgi:plastocyanin
MKLLLSICAIAVLATAGCGSSSSSSTSSSSASTPAAGAGGHDLTIRAAADGLKFDTNQLNATAGKVTITMHNDSPLQHDVALKGGVNVKGDVVTKGGTSTVSTDLKPGQYTYYCSVDGHEGAGMTGTLTVK